VGRIAYPQASGPLAYDPRVEDQPSTPDAGPTSAPEPELKPAGYWITKIVLGLAVAGLGAAELWLERSVSIYIIGLLGVLAGAPEVASLIKKAS